MTKVIAPVAALLLSIAFLIMGNGLQGTLLAVRGGIESFSDVSIGLLGSTYFGGFALGCLVSAKLINRVGHIRTFTAMAALASAAPLVHVMLLAPMPWWIMRVISGFCFAVLYIVIESWLNERATNETRGAILSTYLVINLVVLTLGQFLLTLHDPGGFVLFALTSILVSISAVPVALSASPAPAPVKSSRVRLGHLYKVSPVAFVGCIAVGLTNGTFWALGPVFAQRSGMDVSGIALFMSVVIFGGALGQWPIGLLSDYMDRRRVLMGASGVAAFCGLAIYLGIMFLGGLKPVLLLGMAAIWGMSAFPLYAIAIAHANDHATPAEFVSVSSGLLLVYAGGSIMGPMLASVIMGLSGAHGIFAFTALGHLLLCAYTAFRMQRRVAPQDETHVRFAESLVAAQTVSEVFVNPGEEDKAPVENVNEEQTGSGGELHGSPDTSSGFDPAPGDKR